MLVMVLVRWLNKGISLKRSSTMLTVVRQLWNCSTYCVLLTLIIFQCQVKDKEQWNFHSYRLNITVTAKKNLLYIAFFFCELTVWKCHVALLLAYSTCVPAVMSSCTLGCLSPTWKFWQNVLCFFFHEVLKAIHIYSFNIVKTKAVLDLPEQNSWLLIASCPLNSSSFLIWCRGR